MAARSVSVLDQYPEYEVVIGIEVHVQLATKSKIFCQCANEIVKEPNRNVCIVCAGHPGSLPVLNKKVVDSAIKLGLATHSTINMRNIFDRKHYFYPDLPKNYQITQNFYPICVNGYVPIRLEDGSTKKIRLNRIHIEEDAGKNIHAPTSGESFVDLNRAGTPLLEIVTYPDIASAYEAKEYLKALRAIVLELAISSGNMEEGAFRGDTNISVRKKGVETLGTKRELKNINSFKFIGDAIEYEIEDQISTLEDGGIIKQETRLWDSKNKRTVFMRSKENAPDYCYFEDPDLATVDISEAWIADIKSQMPELPYDKFDRLCKEHGLSAYEAGILVDDIQLARYFEQASKHRASKLLIHWILRDLMGYLNEQKIELADCKVTPEKLADLAGLIEDGKINNNSAKEIFAIVAQTGKDPIVVMQEQGLEQIGSAAELEEIVQKVLAENEPSVAQYKAGKQQLFGFFVGQTMQRTKGKGNPKMIQELLKKYLS